VERFLGVATASLPQTVACPACQAAACEVYQTPRGGRELCHCRACEFQGDVLAFFTKKWGVSPGEAKARLQSETARPLPIEQFWAEASAAAVHVRAADLALRRFRVRRMPEADGWATHLHRLFGVANKRAARAAFRRPLEGPCDAVVVPWWLTPAKIVGLTILTPDSRDDVGPAKADGGLAYLSAAKDEIIAARDFDLVTALHLRNGHQSHTPLPFVCWRPTTRLAWAEVSARKVVVWVPETPTLEDFAQAARAGGLLSPIGWFEGCNKWKYVKGRRPVELAHAVLRNARPWADILKQHLQALTADELAKFVAAADQTNQLNLLLNNVPQRLARRLRAALDVPAPKPAEAVDTAGRRYVQTPEGIFLKSDTGGVLLFDGRIHVQGVKDSVAWGSIVRHGRAGRFRCKVAQPSDRWLRETLARAGVADGAYVAKGYGRLLLSIAVRMVNPRPA
jgi:hypothetical protein